MTPPDTAGSAGLEVAFTPGPWRHKQVFRGDELLRDEILSADGVIADDIRDPRDARLIAAAPDLYEALTETWRILRAAGTLNLTKGVQLGQTSWYVNICDAEAMADAALSRAGKSS